MARALIRANAHLAGHPRGEEREVELTDWQIARAAGGQISIVRTWDLDEGESVLDGRVRAGTIDDLLALVDSGEYTAAEVLDAETRGKNRVGAVEELQERVEQAREQAQAASEAGAGGVTPNGGAEAAEGN